MQGVPIASGRPRKPQVLSLILSIMLSACVSPSTSSQPSSSASANPCPAHLSVKSAVQDFFKDWNQRQQSDFKKLFTTEAELDMSSKSQGASVSDGYTGTVGADAIAEFAARQWKTGEVLSFSAIEVFNGGAYAHSVTSKFEDGRQQTMTDSKFVYDRCSNAFNHVVIVAGSPAA